MTTINCEAYIDHGLSPPQLAAITDNIWKMQVYKSAHANNPGHIFVQDAVLASEAEQLAFMAAAQPAPAATPQLGKRVRLCD